MNPSESQSLVSGPSMSRVACCDSKVENETLRLRLTQLERRIVELEAQQNPDLAASESLRSQDEEEGREGRARHQETQVTEAVAYPASTSPFPSDDESAPSPASPPGPTPTTSTTEDPISRIPNELLAKILGFAHQPFHYYHYSNALLGVTHPLPGSRPWNPIKLQLVSHLWNETAHPLFYAQVAFDTRDQLSIKIATDLVLKSKQHPLVFAKRSVWTLLHPRFPTSLFSLVSRDAVKPTGFILSPFTAHLVPGFRGTLIPITLGLGSIVPSQIRELMTELNGGFLFTIRGTWGGAFNPLFDRDLILRLPEDNLLLFLKQLRRYLPPLASSLRRLQLDFPTNLLPSLLDTVFPVLTSIILDPSLRAGRAEKTVVFGVQSSEDATALRGKVKELGSGLKVVVAVVVLDL